MTTCNTDFLKLLGNFAPTIRGGELKGWTVDDQNGGVAETYLDANECREAARQFLAAAELLERSEVTP